MRQRQLGKSGPPVPADDLAGTLQRLVEEGKSWARPVRNRPLHAERCHAIHPVIAVQNEYSL